MLKTSLFEVPCSVFIIKVCIEMIISIKPHDILCGCGIYRLYNLLNFATCSPLTSWFLLGYILRFLFFFFFSSSYLKFNGIKYSLGKYLPFLNAGENLILLMFGSNNLLTLSEKHEFIR